MEALLAIVVLLVVVTFAVQRINARYETRARAGGPTADDRVEAAWEEFGADDDAAVAAARLDTLAREVRVEDVNRKASLVRYAVMASRGGRADLLPALADRAEALDLGCGETRSLRALAETLAGDDPERARAALLAAQSAVEGCAKCNTTLEARLLAEEVVSAAQSLDERADGAPGEAPAPGGALHVRMVRSG